MPGDIIESKEQLIEALADEFDGCIDQSYPAVDLTGQTVVLVIDSAFAEPYFNEELDGHKIVAIEPPDSHESFRFMERFAYSRPDGQSRALCDALSQRRPFRTFKDAVIRMGIEKEWYAWERESLVK